MYVELILWLLALFFPELAPHRKRASRRRKQMPAKASAGPIRAARGRVGAGIAWYCPLDDRDARRGDGRE